MTARSTPSHHPGAATLAVLFFFSGVVALIYQVIWQRQFALLLGSAAPATAAVLAAYFAGLGAGSLLLGRMAKRWRNPWRVYAVLELLTALGAALAWLIQGAFAEIYPWLFTELAGQPGAFFIAKLALVFIALAVPTFCMGGTLPVLGRLVAQGHQHLGINAGLLYVTNTAGAGLGALSVPFLLLPMLGVNGTLAGCLFGNGLLALVAWQLGKRPTLVEKPPAISNSPRQTKSTVVAPDQTAATFALALISGVATFALQVLWNRAFAQVHENSVHAFAVIVAIVILALALGAQLARIGLRRGLTPRRLLGLGWGFAGLAIACSPWIFLRLTDGLTYLPTDLGWVGYGRRLLMLTAAVLFVPFTLLGIGLPAIMEQAGRSLTRDTSDLLGRLLAVNVTGSVIGALVAGFLLPPWLGLWPSIVAIAWGLALAGLSQWKTNDQARPTPGRSLLWLVLFCLGVWPLARLNLPVVRLDASQQEKLLTLAEGTHGITAVVERPGSRRLKLNNHYVLGGTASTGDERMQSHMPLLLHPAPRRVAFLGMGTGITAGGAMFHPVERIVPIELVPEVVTAAKTHFAEAGAGVLADPRTSVVVEDARNYLRGTREKFDVIIGDLVVPWRQGEGALFTLESFTAARDALAPGGIYCQWLPLFQLSAEEARIIVRTFLTVFPRTTVWRGDFSPTEPAIALIGGNPSFVLDPAVVRRRLAEMRADPANPHLADSTIVWMHFLAILDLQTLSSTGGQQLNRDNHPIVELLGPLQRRRPGGAPWLTSRQLPGWLQALSPASDTAWPALSPGEHVGVQAGGIFAEMVLGISERNTADARAAQDRLRELLPAATFRRLFP